jgi:hypothetical protein
LRHNGFAASPLRVQLKKHTAEQSGAPLVLKETNRDHDIAKERTATS